MSFEHTEDRGPNFVWCLISSASRVATPKRLWASLTLEQPVVAPRLARLAVGGMLLSHLLVTALAVLVATAEWWLARSSAMPMYRTGILQGTDSGLLSSLASNLENIFIPYTAHPVNSGFGSGIPSGMLVIVLAFGVLLPAAYLSLPASMRRAKVHRRHLLRVFAYWLVPLPILASCFPIVHLSASFAFNYALNNMRGSGPDLSLTQFLDHRGSLLSLVPILLYAWWFWSSASSRYLKLPHAHLDAALLVLFAILAALTLEFFLAGTARGAAYAVFTGFFPTAY